jgi:hypothetical protein
MKAAAGQQSIERSAAAGDSLLPSRSSGPLDPANLLGQRLDRFDDIS